jgi:hypothetical protein
MKRLREAGRRKRPEGWRNKTWMLHRDNAPAHTLLLITECLEKYKMTVVPQPPYSTFDPCRLCFVAEVEMHSERSPISDDRRDRRKFAMGLMRYPTNCISGCIPELEKTLEVVYKQWRGVL